MGNSDLNFSKLLEKLQQMEMRLTSAIEGRCHDMKRVFDNCCINHESVHGFDLACTEQLGVDAATSACTTTDAAHVADVSLEITVPPQTLSSSSHSETLILSSRLPTTGTATPSRTRPAPRFLSTRRRGRGSLLASSAVSPPAPASATQSFRALPASETTVLVTGATGYIGRYVVWELLRRGHRMLAVARSRSGVRGRNFPEDVVADFAPAQVIFSDVNDPAALLVNLAPHGPVHAAVCCLASRGGGVQESWRIDYRATLHTLPDARGLGATHFVLLSDICVQKPLLEFQRAKFKFEEELVVEAARDPTCTYSVVRPTAFFKSDSIVEEEVLNTLSNRCLMNCFSDIQSCFSPPFSCSWDAVPHRQPWPPPMQFERQDIWSPIGCGWDAVPHKQPWPPPV